MNEKPVELNIPKETEPVQITLPADYQERVNENLKEYKKWMYSHLKIIEKAEHATTVEEEKAIKDEVVKDFKKRYAGFVAKDTGYRLSPSAVKNIWNAFMRSEYREFLASHVNLTMDDLLDIGIDKFIYTLNWSKPKDASNWRNHKIRIGYCCHCHDQFIAMIIQSNQGLCNNCRPDYSVKAMRNYILKVLNDSDRYHEAHRDALMDFYILFYNDQSFRNLFMKSSEFAQQLEEENYEVPEWVDHPGLKQGDLNG